MRKTTKRKLLLAHAYITDIMFYHSYMETVRYFMFKHNGSLFKGSMFVEAFNQILVHYDKMLNIIPEYRDFSNWCDTIDNALLHGFVKTAANAKERATACLSRAWGRYVLEVEDWKSMREYKAYVEWEREAYLYYLQYLRQNAVQYKETISLL